MSRSKKQKDPFRTLIRGMILLAAAAAICAGIFYGLNAFEKHALDQKIADTKAINEKRIQDYQAAVAEYQSATQKGQNVDWPPHKKEGWDVVDVSAFGLENTYQETVERAKLLTGGMLLVNQWHKLPDDYPSDMAVSVMTASGKKVGAADMEVKLFSTAIDALALAVNDATAAGITGLFVHEGYRTMDKQREYFENKMKALEDQYSGNLLIENTKKAVSEPGTSEYQSGLAFIMSIYPNPNKLAFQASDQGKWFTENCWKYGFIFRYPLLDHPNSSWVDKSYKTGITVSLNLYRWVGIPHAAVMNQMGFCMEEYVEYLIEHPHLAVYEDDVLKYEIFRRPAAGDPAAVTIDVPLAASSYLVSLDNMGGIVTAFIY